MGGGGTVYDLNDLFSVVRLGDEEGWGGAPTDGDAEEELRLFHKR